MSLEDAYSTAGGDSQEHKARTEWDGTGGYIQTGGVDESFDPSDVEGILRKFGYDPDKVEIVGDPRVSRWEQFSSKPGSRGSRWLSAYRFHIRTKAIESKQKALVAACEKTPGMRCSVAAFVSTGLAAVPIFPSVAEVDSVNVAAGTNSVTAAVSRMSPFARTVKCPVLPST